MPSYLNPKTGAAIGYQETHGTTAEPFNVPMIWQSTTLSYITMTADAAGNLNVTGGGGGGGAVSIADGANVVEGFVADVAVTGDTSGTISGKLRGLLKIITSVWDSANGRLVVTPESTDEATRLDNTAAPVAYVGKAKAGTATSAASWKIFQMTTDSSGDIIILYAAGSASYTQIWDNRASLSYS